jgi:hypothetical protein
MTYFKALSYHIPGKLRRNREEGHDVAGPQSKSGTQEFLNMKPNGRQQTFTLKIMLIFAGIIMNDRKGGTG